MHYKDYAIGEDVAPNYMGNHKKAMVLSLRDSLAKLQTTYIDIFSVHMWDYSSGIKVIMNSLHILVKQERCCIWASVIRRLESSRWQMSTRTVTERHRLVSTKESGAS